MTEYFIVANSKAAPFFSDTSTHFVTASNPTVALKQFKETYKHSCGLYAAVLFANSDAYHKSQKPIAKWVCNFELEKQKVTKDLGCYLYMGIDKNTFEVNNVKYTIKNPDGGETILF